MRPERIQNPDHDQEDGKTNENTEAVATIAETLKYFRELRDKCEGTAMKGDEVTAEQRRKRLAMVVDDLEKIESYIAYHLF